MSKILDQLLEKRGFGRDFLRPKYEETIDPFLLPEMRKAVERVREAVERGERVLIYGDYDVDGVTASTALYDALKLAGVKEIEIMLPNRFTDGYGMSKKIVQRVAETQGRTGESPINLVFTVDCGSRNQEIVAELKKIGVEVVITDHHECNWHTGAEGGGDEGEQKPEAVAIVNPKRRDWLPEESQLEKALELRDLAGVGVVFKLAQALVKVGLIPEGQEKWLLDLVAIGTVCDSMVLLGENRRLCRYGMLVLEKTRRPGLKELLLLAATRRIDSETIGFQIGPRLNAAGRMDTAEKALALLMAKKRTEAARIAQELETLNQERRAQQQAALAEIEAQGVGEDPVIVVSGDWHEGVLGIIAGKLTEAYHRPAFAFGPAGETWKGSGRSFGDFSLAAALEVCEKEIIGGGGHAGACGVKLAKEGLEKFRVAVNDYYRSLNLTDQERFLELQADVIVEEFEDLSLELVEELRSLEPYGEGNREPVFLLAGVRVVEVGKLGAEGRHLRLVVWDKAGKSLKLMCFYAPEEYLRLSGGEIIDVWMTLTENEFRGIRSVEGRILKIA